MQTKALQSTADLVMFDLEDSVALTEKEAARQQVITTLKDLPEHHPRLAPRCNGLETAWFYRDVIKTEAAVDQFLSWSFPRSRTQVMWLVSAAYGWNRTTHKGQQTIRLHACIESPAGRQSEAIAGFLSSGSFGLWDCGLLS